MRILLTGAAGQLGSAVLHDHTTHHEVIPAYHSAPPHDPRALTMNLGDPTTIAKVVSAARPDWVLHAAAMTDVDGCERDPGRANAVNAVGSGAIADAARQVGARFLYVSTDYVFDGAKGAYREDDPTGPVNVYGASKLAGEALVRTAVPDAVIARTAGVFEAGPRGFASWIIRGLRTGETMRVVTDQRLNPTYASDLARQVLALIDAGVTGAFHTAGATPVSRYDMAVQVAAVFGLESASIRPARSSEIGWLARRPADTTLDVTRVREFSEPLSLEQALLAFRKEYGK